MAKYSYHRPNMRIEIVGLYNVDSKCRRHSILPWINIVVTKHSHRSNIRIESIRLYNSMSKYRQRSILPWLNMVVTKYGHRGCLPRTTKFNRAYNNQREWDYVGTVSESYKPHLHPYPRWFKSLLQMDFSVFWFAKMVDTCLHHKTNPFCAKELTPMKDLEFLRMFPSQRTAMTSS